MHSHALSSQLSALALDVRCCDSVFRFRVMPARICCNKNAYGRGAEPRKVSLAIMSTEPARTANTVACVQNECEQTQASDHEVLRRTKTGG